MKATGKQASAALQHVLAMYRFQRSTGETFHTILIRNSSDRPIVFLDVVISCYPMGRRPITLKLRGWDDQILSSGDSANLQLDFTKQLTALRIGEDACGYHAEIVVSDLSRQVAIQYGYTWVVGRFVCKNGLHLRVRWRYRLSNLRWRYYRGKKLFSSR